jgi:hypothetical protein
MSTGDKTSGGEGGIRTLGTGVSPYNGLANRRLQPLGHLSGDFHQFNMVCGGSSAGLHPGASSRLSAFFYSGESRSLTDQRGAPAISLDGTPAVPAPLFGSRRRVDRSALRNAR